jgi:uncharacterized protein (TIGR03435 family)
VGIAVTGLAVSLAPPTPLRAQAQVSASRPSFEVASIKENTSGDSRTRMATEPGGHLLVTNAQLKELIAVAYLNPQPFLDHVLGGPDWLASARYDINAKAITDFEPRPDGPAKELLQMMQSLLEERFKLRTHHETRELPIYQLVVARADGRLGPEMRPSDSDCDAIAAGIRAGVPPPRKPGEPPPCGSMGGPARIIAGGVTMPQFATTLSTRLERPVVDKTNLTGRFKFTLAFTPEQMPTGTPPPGVPPIDPNGPSFFTALQEQLGLKLESVKGPVDVLVVDSIERPTPD